MPYVDEDGGSNTANWYEEGVLKFHDLSGFSRISRSCKHPAHNPRCSQITQPLRDIFIILETTYNTNDTSYKLCRILSFALLITKIYLIKVEIPWLSKSPDFPVREKYWSNMLYQAPEIRFPFMGSLKGEYIVIA